MFSVAKGNYNGLTADEIAIIQKTSQKNIIPLGYRNFAL